MKSNFDRILSSEDVMRRRATLLQRMHIDGPLLILLLTLAAGSLFVLDRTSTRLNSSHGYSSYSVFCLKKKK